jgi:hypothetical protein
MTFTAILVCLYQYVLLFFAGSVAGWGLEVVWRRFFGQARRWINPGFMSGPWLPLYGFGTILLYEICRLEYPVLLNALVFFFLLTALEFLAGLISVYHFRIRLWDYRRNRGNILGIVCPLYSILWMFLGLGFQARIFPYLDTAVSFVARNPEFSFFLGLYGGTFGLDLWQSLDLAARIKAFVRESGEKWHVDYESFKLELRDRIPGKLVNKTRYLLPFYGELGSSLRERLERHRRNLPRPLNPLKRALRKRKKS